MSSCEKSIVRKVFFGFELGVGFNTNNQRIESLVKNGVWKKTKADYPYYVNKLPGNMEYYSSPFFFTVQGDTTVWQLKVIYLTDLKNLQLDFNLNKIEK